MKPPSQQVGLTIFAHAVLLDAGGVLIIPEAKEIAAGLRRFGARTRDLNSEHLHYESVAAFDRSGRPGDYAKSYAFALGVAKRDVEMAADDPVFQMPWTTVLPGARKWLATVALGGLSLAIVSDSDGTVAHQLAAAGLCQVGPGVLPRVDAICDSAIIGARKPARKIFLAALAAISCPPDRALHVGDSWRCDVRGAQAVGVQPIHLDPLDLCARRDHNHAGSLSELDIRLPSGYA